MVAKGKQVENEGDAHTFEAKHRLLDGHRRMQYGLSVAGKLMRLCYSGILREYGGNRTTRTARDEANTEEGVQVLVTRPCSVCTYESPEKIWL